jgi:nucleoside-diphosphate-sugar epimerase
VGSSVRTSSEKGRLTVLGSKRVPLSYVHIDDLARHLAQALEVPDAVGRRIDIATDRPVSQQEIAELFTTILGRQIRPLHRPGG